MQQVSIENIKKALKESREKRILNEENESSRGPGRQKLSDEERRERLEEKERLAAEKRAAREQLRLEKKTLREEAKASRVPHMKKVEKQAKNLPTLAVDQQELVDDVLARFDETAITAVIANLQFELRKRATEQARHINLEVDQLVRITSAEGSNAKWIGHLAHVTKSQRIRCYVTPVGSDKEVYLFTSNVSPVSEDEVATLTTQDEEVQDNEELLENVG